MTDAIDGFQNVHVPGHIAGEDQGAGLSQDDIRRAREAYLRARKATAQADKAKRDNEKAKRIASGRSKSPSVKRAKQNGQVTSRGIPRRETMPGHGEPPPAFHTDQGVRDAAQAFLPRPSESAQTRENANNDAPPRPRGRPVGTGLWTPELQAAWKAAVITWLQTGKSLMAFCREHPNGPPRGTILAWRHEDAIFSDAYDRARADGADALADEIIDIADEVKDASRDDSAKVNAARLRVDARKWSASKLKPATYAERVEQGLSVKVSGTVEHKITDDQRAQALAAFLARQAAANAASLPEAMKLIEASAIDVTPAQTETKP